MSLIIKDVRDKILIAHDIGPMGIKDNSRMLEMDWQGPGICAMGGHQ